MQNLIKIFILSVFFLCALCGKTDAQQYPFAFHKSALSPEAQQYINRLPDKPGQDTLVKIAELIDSLKQNGIWAKVDCMWLFANKTAANSVIDLKGLSDATFVNSPTFSVYRGVTSDGATSYVNTNFNDSTDAFQFTLSGNSIGAYSRTNTASTSSLMGLKKGAASNFCSIIPRNGSNLMFSYNYDDCGNSGSNSDSRGFFINNRTTNTIKGYRNATEILSASCNYLSRAGRDFFVCARNDGSPASITTREVSFAYVGANLSVQEITNFNSCLERLLDYLGAGVQ